MQAHQRHAVGAGIVGVGLALQRGRFQEVGQPILERHGAQGELMEALSVGGVIGFAPALDDLRHDLLDQTRNRRTGSPCLCQFR